MLPENSHKMALEERRQFVSSLYADRGTMNVGAAAMVVALLLSFASANDPAFLVFVALILLVGVLRHRDGAAFAAQTDAFKHAGLKAIRRWELRYTIGGMMMATLIGLWGFYAAVFVPSPFSLLVAVSASMMQLVGVAGRNFGSSRLVMLQSLALGVPITAGVLLRGGWLNAGLAFLFVPCFFSAIVIAANIRAILAAVIANQARANFNAQHDPLTSLPNRNYFRELVTSVVDRRGDHAMIALDLDDFKTVNDTYGHQAGDSLLREVAKRLHQAAGDDAILCRQGGDEFVLFCPTGAKNDSVVRLAHSVRDSLRQPICYDGVVVHARCSIGVAFASAGARVDIDDLMMKADLALYEAKRSGKGMVRLFEDSTETLYKRRRTLKSDLEMAIASGGMNVVYQPILNMSNGRVSVCEALLRWVHPEFGPVSPTEFIPLAEEMGCVPDLTAFVLREATVACRTWSANECRVSVNLSAVDLRDPTRLIADVRDALDRSGLPSEMLELEVTETAILADKSTAEAVLRELRQDKVRICLDDFGTGYSNFSYLLQLPLDKLKIDRSLVDKIAYDAAAQAITNGVSVIAKKIGMTVTVEGIESMKQLKAAMACAEIDEVQGWVYSKAICSSDVANYIRHTAIHPRTLSSGKRQRVAASMSEDVAVN